MKKDKNQIIYAVIAAALFIAVIIVGYNQLSHGTTTSSKVVTYQIATPIQSTLNQSTLSQLSNISQTQDFSVKLNTATGLGNASPFGG